jgi:hypothetical protein
MDSGIPYEPGTGQGQEAVVCDMAPDKDRVPALREGGIQELFITLKEDQAVINQ